MTVGEKSVCQKDRDPEVEARMSSKDKHGGSAQQVEIPDIILDTSTHRKYERGRFLGKVSFVFFQFPGFLTSI